MELKELTDRTLELFAFTRGQKWSRIKQNDYIFARELMKQTLSDRELWLTGKVLESLGDDYDFSDYIDYRKMIGGVTSHVKYN